jgi:acetyl-CoA C-acetyltransferase
MKSAIIASAVRSMIVDLGGGLADDAPCSPKTSVAREAISRSGLDPAGGMQTVISHVITTASRDMYLGSLVTIQKGMPETAPVLSINKLCGSRLQAALSAAEHIMLGSSGVILAGLAGKAESIGRLSHLLRRHRVAPK